MKPPRTEPPQWSIHVDHPWSQCVQMFGAPMRANIWTPWGFFMIGVKSQVYDIRAKKYTDRWSYITYRPRP